MTTETTSYSQHTLSPAGTALRQLTQQHLRTLLALAPVIHHLIALCLCGGALLLLQHPQLLPALGKYHDWLANVLRGLAAWQLVLSARQSLLLPLATLAFAGAGLTLVSHGLLSTGLSSMLLKELMLLGVIGLAVSIFNIR